MNLLLKRNFGHAELSEEEQSKVANADVLVEQLQSADNLLIAFPMYNFSVPATVKAWIDAITQLGKTFSVREDGSYKGLCEGKHALILNTTGADFGEEPMKSMNFATPLVAACMSFVGINSHCISAYGLNQYEQRADEIVADAGHRIETYLREDPNWLGAA